MKFSFHCFTSHGGRGLAPGAQEDRPVFIDPDSHERDRVFDPQRWAWSHWLPGMFDRLSSLRTVNMRRDYGLAAALRIGPSSPYVAYFDVGLIRIPDHRTIVQVNSAFVNTTNPPDVSAAPRFSQLLREALRDNKRPGAK